MYGVITRVKRRKILGVVDREGQINIMRWKQVDD